MVIWQHGEGVGGEECHTVFTEISFELLTFMTFIADHNSTFENFFMLGVVYHKQTFWKVPLGTQECF